MADRLLKRLEDMNRRECLWIYILRILRDTPMHAYALRREIEKRFGFRPGTVTSYRVIYSLSSGGFVSKKTEGRRKMYHITEKGKRELESAARFYESQSQLLR